MTSRGFMIILLGATLLGGCAGTTMPTKTGQSREANGPKYEVEKAENTQVSYGSEQPSASPPSDEVQALIEARAWSKVTVVKPAELITYYSYEFVLADGSVETHSPAMPLHRTVEELRGETDALLDAGSFRVAGLVRIRGMETILYVVEHKDGYVDRRVVPSTSLLPGTNAVQIQTAIDLLNAGEAKSAISSADQGGGVTLYSYTVVLPDGLSFLYSTDILVESPVAPFTAR